MQTVNSLLKCIIYLKYMCYIFILHYYLFSIHILSLLMNFTSFQYIIMYYVFLIHYFCISITLVNILNALLKLLHQL
jgi:hypothetical protein